jgi:hypothetical protein
VVNKCVGILFGFQSWDPALPAPSHCQIYKCKLHNLILFKNIFYKYTP